MLKKRRGGEDPAAQEVAGMAEEKTPGRSASAGSGAEKTVIGEHVTIEGSIRGGENLIIQGTLRGNIDLEKNQLTVGSKGFVEGEVRAENVTVSGRMIGNIHAVGKVQVNASADFQGEIKARRISVEDGAFIKAVIEMERESEKREGPAAMPTVEVALGPGMGPKPVAAVAEADKGK